MLKLALFALLGSATALPDAPKPYPPPQCTDFIIPITARAPVKLVGNGQIPENLDDPTVLVDFIVSQADSGLAALLGLVGTTETSGTFDMSARYCEPANKAFPARARNIQYLQHAITMTKNYWNGLSYPVGYQGDMYSWIYYASSQGFPTISIDNLGSGNSSHPDPVAVVQMSLQIEIAHQIIQKLRAGTVGGPLEGRSFDKIIYAGHSYGSIQGNGLAATYPKDVDCYVLTGYTGDFLTGLVPLASGIAIPAAIAMPDRYAGLNPLYLAQSLESGRVYGLYTVNGVGGFDPDAAQYDFNHEGTVALGELATLFYGVTPADDYTGYVYVITGRQDAIVCNGLLGADCGYGPTSKPAIAGKFFPNAKDYSYIIPDRTGHNANIHYSSPNSFRLAHEYLTSKGF